MTKEELEKEAYLYAKNSKDVQDFECGFDIAFKSYLASAEPREKQISELKADNDARKFAMAMSETVEKQLREENSKLKDEWQEQVQKATDEGYARTLQTIQLTKAKELLEQLVNIEYAVNIPKEKIISLRVKAEQFLKESEVEK